MRIHRAEKNAFKINQRVEKSFHRVGLNVKIILRVENMFSSRIEMNALKIYLRIKNKKIIASCSINRVVAYKY